LKFVQNSFEIVVSKEEELAFADFSSFYSCILSSCSSINFAKPESQNKDCWRKDLKGYYNCIMNKKYPKIEWDLLPSFKKGQKGYCTKIANKDEYLIETNK